MLHFETIIIFRNEKRHAALKKQFENFIENLKTVIDDIALILMNNYQNDLIKIVGSPSTYAMA